MKQSSIDWLVDQMFKQGFFDGNKPLSYTTLDHLQHQAKAMHKEEHRNTFNQGLMSNFQNFDDYYNETFNTNQKNLPDSTNGYTYYPQERKIIFNTKEK